MKIHCAHNALVDPATLKPNPVNPNRHSAHQIQLLASIIQEQGWRGPITVSKRSGLIVRGHGRLEAALLMGAEKVPVDYQDYASEAEELADLLADNRLSELAELDEDDLKRVIESIRTSDPSFDVELTGFMEDEIARLYDEKPEDDVETVPRMEIRSNVEQLVRTQDSPREFEKARQRALPRIVGSIDFLERILTDMRTYSQTVSRERTAERIADLLAEAHRLVIEELSARGLDTESLDVAIEVPPMLTAKVSRVSIVMAFRNVVKNACEALLDSDERFCGSVAVTARELDSSLVEIVVSDTGPGLEPSELDQVREFLPGKTSKKYIGTGFGPPIARRNLRAHGGSIHFDSAVNNGSRVTMVLPPDADREARK